ncbi:hypothetical protein CDL15_Pgr028929 [Punica granatum]|uniref:Uncharacterized protein n=1 Tax=Punica granatum TaxID=22663 RepID=A0A218WYZ3_PUNGR|nr:hypothetical protein CDL15_Pgr028929 [Punica granatum]
MRRPCCAKEGLNRGAWSAEEDEILTYYIKSHGEGQWRDLPQRAGLKRCGKSCRLRWVNYLRPYIKRGNICEEEEELILRMHKLLGNRWALIAARLPGRTDNEIKNYWNTNLRKRVRDRDRQKFGMRTRWYPAEEFPCPPTGCARRFVVGGEHIDLNCEIDFNALSSLLREGCDEIFAY